MINIYLAFKTGEDTCHFLGHVNEYFFPHNLICPTRLASIKNESTFTIYIFSQTMSTAGILQNYLI